MPHPLDQLHLLSENEDLAISRIAKKALQYSAELDAGNLSPDEYKDLMEDLQTSRDIAGLADELDCKQLLASAISGAIGLVA